LLSIIEFQAFVEHIGIFFAQPNTGEEMFGIFFSISVGLHFAVEKSEFLMWLTDGHAFETVFELGW
jgi:hypothetical protein